MKERRKPREPSKASLREIPEIDFDKATVRRNADSGQREH
jgi:hypothetical protein